MQAVVEHDGVGQSSQVRLWTWVTMEGEVYPVAEVGVARELGWAREVAGVLVACEVAGVWQWKMKNEGLDHNISSFNQHQWLNQERRYKPKQWRKENHFPRRLSHGHRCRLFRTTAFRREDGQTQRRQPVFLLQNMRTSRQRLLQESCGLHQTK